METKHLQEALTTATAALAAAECCCDKGEALSDLAGKLAADDGFVASLLAHLSNDIERATQLTWDSGYHIAKELARQDRSTG